MEEKKLTDDTEIDVGMIEKVLGMDCLCVVYSDCCNECPLYDKQCGEILPKAIKDLIQRLQSENESLKKREKIADEDLNNVSNEWGNCRDENAKLKAEIERLTKDLNLALDIKETISGIGKSTANLLSENEKLLNEKIELQKQVDELKEERANMQADWLDGYKVGFRDGVVALRTQIVNKIDEICKEILEKGV